jgi:hypothetical protein
MHSVLFSLAASAALMSSAAAQTTVFTETFEGSASGAIAPGTARIEGVQGYAGLGPVGNQFGGTFLRSPTGNQVVLTLTGLPAHRAISLDFLFAAIDSLDGAGTYPAGDYFKITLDGGSIFREAFANALASQIQTYAPPPGVTLARHMNLGFGVGSYYTDSAYHFGADPVFADFPHQGDTAVFTFQIEGAGIQPIGDESWAMDNLRVRVSGLPAGSVSPYGISCGPVLDAQGTPGLGRPLPLALTQLPAGAVLALCAFGTSNTGFSGAPLPLPLGFVGASGCWLLQDASVTSAYPMVLGTGNATATVPIPNDEVLAGFQIFVQGWSLAPGASASGLFLSNGLRLVVGV